MATPIVVQATPVMSPQVARPTMGPPTNPPQRGEKQGSGCKDIPFAILFYVNVVVMVIVAAAFGPDALSVDDDEKDANGQAEESTREYDGYVYAAIICVFLSVLGSIGGVAVMMCIPETLIKVALIFVVVMAGLWMLMAFVSGALGAAVLGAIFFAISICYARAACE